MSANQRATQSQEAVEAPAAVSILFNLPEELHTPLILRALICAEQSGYLRGCRSVAAAALASVRLSSSRQS